MSSIATIDLPSVQSESVRAAKLPPWIASPYDLITWWDMEKFSAEAFMELSRVLTVFETLEDAAVIENRNPVVIAQLSDCGKKCQEVGLFLSAKCAHTMIDLISDGLCSLATFRRMSHELGRRIHDEASLRSFFSLSVDEAAYFEAQQFDPTSVTNFPSAVDDMEEAGKCFGLSRYSACVMHLSRVVEVGLTTLAVKELLLPPRNDWGKYLTDIEKELANRLSISKARSADEIFYSEAAAQIDHIRRAWRNPSMHVARRYNKEIAQDIFNAIKAFMRHLATKLHE